MQNIKESLDFKMIQIDISKKLHGASGVMQLEVNLNIRKGEFIALRGASGSGKTTLLRILAGLEEAKGTIEVNNSSWLHNANAIAPQKRSIGFVFQESALFDNMNILQNLLFVQKNRKLALRLLEITGLLELQERYPKTLSGGQQQRVSLCRAMMREPQLLLLDEPLSALDPKMRKNLQEQILKLHKEFHMTTLMVSHDTSEIYKLATRIITLDEGKITQDGSTKEILLQRKGSQKFSFTGELVALHKEDVISVAVIAIGQQLVEVVLSKQEAKNLHVGQDVIVGTKAFSPTILSP